MGGVGALLATIFPTIGSSGHAYLQDAHRLEKGEICHPGVAQSPMPARIMVQSHSASFTPPISIQGARWSDSLAEMLAAPRAVLRGELGMGKTTLVRGVAAALGADVSEVASPTFTLVHEYAGKRTRLIHLDLYRLEEERELEPIGLWETAEATDSESCALELHMAVNLFWQ